MVEESTKATACLTLLLQFSEAPWFAEAQGSSSPGRCTWMLMHPHPSILLPFPGAVHRDVLSPAQALPLWAGH